ncbi:MAG: hypothetical protein C7B46_20310 [Sulfobacillus benefaciens]|uniref:Uncharacterized protein n=1 Tax=Sulfobacillus benefaciens TaxID=453960 RepID=A0A2T2WUY0_9FIRM|nr:MAG: hypothetical protein C7B46_20310 [Sulfobacillus benefaciens]
MKLPGGWHLGSADRHFRALTMRTVLVVGSDRIMAGEGLGTPLWIEVRAFLWRQKQAVWHKLRPGPITWWTAQLGTLLVLVGYGRRPPVLLRQENWRGIVPMGHGATTVTLPAPTPCEVVVATTNPKRIAN